MSAFSTSRFWYFGDPGVFAGRYTVPSRCAALCGFFTAAIDATRFRNCWLCRMKLRRSSNMRELLSRRISSVRRPMRCSRSPGSCMCKYFVYSASVIRLRPILHPAYHVVPPNGWSSGNCNESYSAHPTLTKVGSASEFRWKTMSRVRT